MAEGIVQVLVADLRLRAEPSTESEALAGLSAGQLVHATGNTEAADGITWVEVVQQPSERTGWVASSGPDGSPWLATVRDGPIGITTGDDAVLIDPDSGDHSPLTSGMAVSDLVFAPDGESVGLIDFVEGARIVALDDAPIGPAPTPTPGEPVFGPPVRISPAFAPDGEVMAFLSGQALLSLSMIWLGEGAPPSFPFPGTLHPLGWSPDSRHLVGAEWVNVGTAEPENWEIVVVEEGASQSIRLTTRQGTDIHPAWSPDGSMIAFLQDNGDGTFALVLMNADGSDQRALITVDGLALSAARPAWSPDGSRVAVAQQVEGVPAMIHLVDAVTSEHVSIAAPDNWCGDLTWSPTGTRIAFVCRPEQSEQYTAYVTSVIDPEVTEFASAATLDWARILEPMR